MSLKRFIETRSVAHSPAVYRAELEQIGILEKVWIKWAEDNPSDAEVIGLVNQILEPHIIPNMTIIADVVVILASFSEGCQPEEESNIFAAHERLKIFRKKLEEMRDTDPEICRYNHFFRKNLSKMRQGKYQDVELRLHRGMFTRARKKRHAVSADTILENSKQLQRKMLTEILARFATRLAEHKTVKLMLKIFNFEKYYFEQIDLNAQYEKEFLELVEFFNGGSLKFPKEECSENCAGSSCPCLLNQYKKFKWRVMNQENQKKFRKYWKRSRALKKGKTVSILKENDQITPDNFKEYCSDDTNGRKLKFCAITQKLTN